MSRNIQPVVVVHAVKTWLSQTMAWLYSQLTNLPSRIESHIVCGETANLDQFPWSNMRALDIEPRRRQIWERALRKMGMSRHLRLLSCELERTNASILHSHFGDLGWRNLHAAAKAGVLHVVTFYGHDVSRMPHSYPVWRSRFRELFADVDLILCEGPYMGRSIAALGCPEHKIRVHHLGVDLANLSFRPRSWSRGEPLKVLIASSFLEKKGIKYALSALAGLRAELELSITLIGDAPNNANGISVKAEILSILRESGLDGQTTLLGYQPHAVLIEKAYQNHLFIAPSVVASDGDSEGGAPAVLMEMAATGMPLISTRHCDIPNVIEDGRSGFLADERDVAGLMCCLRRWVDNTDGWLNILEAGRKRMEQQFDVRKQSEALADIYQSLAS